MRGLFDDQIAEAPAAAPKNPDGSPVRRCLQCGFREDKNHQFPQLRFADGALGLICSDGCRSQLEDKHGPGKRSWDEVPA